VAQRRYRNLIHPTVNLLLRYLSFWFRSGNAHSVHSPFVFDLYTRVIRSAEKGAGFADIEAIRRQLLSRCDQIEVTDFGAGSRVSHSNRRRIRDIARYAEKDARIGQLLYRLVGYFKPQTIFDLGTSLGVTTLYLAAPNQQASVFTFEGCPQTLGIAEVHFARMGYRHVIPVAGNLDDTLPAALRTVEALDFAFFDANHRLEPTIRYFQACLEKAREDSVFVFDDIYWSREMTQDWEQIKGHPAVTLTIDLFHVGFVFFRRQQPKQHFTLRL